MVDFRFYKKPMPLSLEDLCGLAGLEVLPQTSNLFFEGVSSLEEAKPTDVACFHNMKYLKELEQTKAGACLIEAEHASHAPKGTVALISGQPYRAFGRVASLFFPPVTHGVGISPFAKIHPSVRLGRDVQMGAYSVIDDNVIMGDDVVIGAHVSIKSGVEIGDGTRIEDHVSISHTILGARCFIKPGARIGQPGFGFHMDGAGHFDVPQLGRVLIGDDVQIGANCTIDRGSQKDTVIGRGVRIDNLVQIAHNVEIGDNSVLVAQVGVAGSTKLGKFVIAAGQVGIAGHLNIGDGVRIAAQSGLMRDVEAGATVGGSPAISIGDWHRQTIMLKRLIQKKQSSTGAQS